MPQHNHNFTTLGMVAKNFALLRPAKNEQNQKTSLNKNDPTTVKTATTHTLNPPAPPAAPRCRGHGAARQPSTPQPKAQWARSVRQELSCSSRQNASRKRACLGVAWRLARAFGRVPLKQVSSVFLCVWGVPSRVKKQETGVCVGCWVCGVCGVGYVSFSKSEPFKPFLDALIQTVGWLVRTGIGKVLRLLSLEETYQTWATNSKKKR